MCTAPTWALQAPEPQTESSQGRDRGSLWHGVERPRGELRGDLVGRQVPTGSRDSGPTPHCHGHELIPGGFLGGGEQSDTGSEGVSVTVAQDC